VLKPPAVAPGARIAVVSPASPFNRDEFDLGVLTMIRTTRAALPLLRKATFARVVNVALASSPGEGVLQHAPDGTWGYSLYEDAADAIPARVRTPVAGFQR